MLTYYYHLPKDRQRDFQGNINASTAVLNTARRAFSPFKQYIYNAIEALNKKEISAKWKKVSSEMLAELQIIGGLYEIRKQTVIQLDHNSKGLYKIISHIDDPDFSEKLKYKSGKEKGEIDVSKEDFEKGLIRLPIEATYFDNIIWGFDTIQIEPAWIVCEPNTVFQNAKGEPHKIIKIEENDIITLSGTVSGKLFLYGKELSFRILSSSKSDSKQEIIQHDEQRTIVYSKTKIEGAERIPDKKLASFIHFDKIFLPDGSTLKATREDEGLSIILQNQSDFGKTVFFNHIEFKIEKPHINNQDAYWIQLIEIDDHKQDDVISGLSPLRYFFDDGVSIEDEKGNQYTIVNGRESEHKIILKKGREFSFPYTDIIKLKVNTYPLRKQQHAINALWTMPIGEHKFLINLFNDRKHVRWSHAPETESIQNWVVITDENRSGSKEQRQFVRQAINTPDFAILEGPPGSGKTTVILELICQLAQRGKRVLLCGSTHVAIDNVLERLQEKQKGKSLLERFHILPVRIGDEKRINEDIKEFQINNLIKNNDIDEQLLLDASNLVCGTTIGILQHPNFKETGRNWEKEPTVPQFDYLIIDESSKTTFQEFLVPALYAKRWVLVGDVMQLSPFTEREEIVSNLEQLKITEKDNNQKDEFLPIELQQAVFFLHKLKDCLRGKHNKFILPVSLGVLIQIQKELEYRQSENFGNKIIRLLHHQNYKTITPLELVAYDIVIVEDSIFEKVTYMFPESHAVLRSPKWLESAHAFTHNVYQQKCRFEYKDRGKDLNDSFEILDSINAYFNEKSWAEEIAWRIDREHQLRLKESNKTAEKYSKVVEELLPKSFKREKVEEEINQIAAMAFPSILESLVRGIKGRKLKFETTISEGFSEEELKKRRTTLVYQHRMHPEISVFPRNQFYKEKDALKDLEYPIHVEDMRQWDYTKYDFRSIWVDVKGETRRNYNIREVQEWIRHLREFINFAKENPQPEGKGWTIACLTFYRGQETKMREELQRLTGNEKGFSNFDITNGKYPINIKLHTVDKFQGHEADMVFLSMVQTTRDGFMDNPNRLNVAITRAKFQLVIIGNHDYFSQISPSEDLKKLAKNTHKI